jgi:hypothetical protein
MGFIIVIYAVCIHRGVVSDITARLALASMITQRCYCNAVLASLSHGTIPPLELMQSCAARLVYSLLAREGVTPALI